MEPVDSVRDSSEPTMIFNPKLLDCCVCFQHLTIPVFQCDNGHIVCSTCQPKLKNKCHKCSLRISSKHCKAIENLLLSIEISCPNAKYGCREKISYIGNRKHEEECIHEPCYCPYSGCDFVASSKVLSNHFNHEHGDSKIGFSYGDSFVVSLKSNNEIIVLREKKDGKLFILNNSTILLGNAVNISCIGPTSSKFECSYDILARSQNSKLKLRSFAKNFQRFSISLATFSTEFLMIPFGSFEPLKLQICINPSNAPTMQILIKTLYGKSLPVNVKSLDTIVKVKSKILYTEEIPVLHQRLLFCGRELEDNMTIANYNIQHESILHLIVRLIGD